MPVYQALENVLGLKALAWDYHKRTFVSPACRDFVWTQGGLTASKCGLGKNHKVPDWDCTCGLYAVFDISIAEEYINGSPISPIFMVEASGVTIIHDFGYRSEEMTVRWVLKPTIQDTILEMASFQAADYFDVEMIDTATAILIMDIWNVKHEESLKGDMYVPEKDRYHPRSLILRGVPREQILELEIKGLQV